MPKLVAALARTVLRLAVLAGLAVLVIAYAVSEDGLTGGELLGIGLLLAPPVVLGVLWAALRELAELPEKLRRMPETARGHGQDLRQLGDELRTPGKRLVRVPVVLWRLRGAAELVRPHAAVLPFLSVPFLTLSALAAFAAVAEVVIALVLLIGALI
jgi:hypothetical protein